MGESALIPLTQLVSTVSIFNIKCPVLSLKISFAWMTLFMNNMCAALHFFSMISLTDRSCGYLAFVPFPNISSDGHIKHRCKSKGQSRGNPHSVCHTRTCLCYSSKFCRSVRPNINPLLKLTLSVYVNIA